MTNRAVMQQALKCIERCNKHGWILADYEDEVESAITALREALAQPEQKPVAYDKTEINGFVQELYDKKMQEGKHGHYETMFHVVHQAIKKVSPPAAQPEQEPVAWGVFEGNLHDMFFSQSEAQEMAALKGTHAEVRPLYTTPPTAPVAWKWHQAPVKTSWGHDMVVADLAIDKDNTVSVYCERDQTNKVEAMFNPPAQPEPVQEPVEVNQDTMELAESVGLIGPASRTHDLHAAIQRFHDLICVNATIKAAQMAADAIREATPPAAQPEQEPWRESASDYERGVIDGRQMQAQSSVDKAVNAMTQRPWVGLTDEEIDIIYQGAGKHDLLNARAIEAALKERNT